MDFTQLLIFSAVFILLSLMFQVFAVKVLDLPNPVKKTEADKRHTSINRNHTAYYGHRSGEFFQ
nr:hypothetical protein [Bacillus velezensis]